MSLIETAKDIYELAKKSTTIELQEKVMDLREQALALEEENLELRTRVRDLEERSREKSSMRFQAPYYFRNDDPVPFCAICWERDGKMIHMRKYLGGDAQTYHTCGVCGITDSRLPIGSRENT